MTTGAELWGRGEVGDEEAWTSVCGLAGGFFTFIGWTYRQWWTLQRNDRFSYSGRVCKGVWELLQATMEGVAGKGGEGREGGRGREKGGREGEGREAGKESNVTSSFPPFLLPPLRILLEKGSQVGSAGTEWTLTLVVLEVDVCSICHQKQSHNHVSRNHTHTVIGLYFTLNLR